MIDWLRAFVYYPETPPASPSDLNEKGLSTFMIVVYTATGLGLYWLYRKAKHA